MKRLLKVYENGLEINSTEKNIITCYILAWFWMNGEENRVRQVLIENINH